jgi:hypothetical protein
MSTIKKPIRAFAVIIDIKDFPQNSTVCPFCVKSRCIPQGIYSAISVSTRPGCCPLRTAYAYEMEKAGGK